VKQGTLMGVSWKFMKRKIRLERLEELKIMFVVQQIILIDASISIRLYDWYLPPVMSIHTLISNSVRVNSRKNDRKW
jgi:hypothetical protein